jgi:hypothetical protein
MRSTLTSKWLCARHIRPWLGKVIVSTERCPTLRAP